MENHLVSVVCVHNRGVSAIQGSGLEGCLHAIQGSGLEGCLQFRVWIREVSAIQETGLEGFQVYVPTNEF